MSRAKYENETNMTWEQVRAKNLAEGKCIDCGGTGLVADMTAIRRYGDPHANRRCRRCKGTGKPMHSAAGER